MLLCIYIIIIFLFSVIRILPCFAISKISCRSTVEDQTVMFEL